MEPKTLREICISNIYENHTDFEILPTSLKLEIYPKIIERMTREYPNIIRENMKLKYTCPKCRCEVYPRKYRCAYCNRDVCKYCRNHQNGYCEIGDCKEENARKCPRCNRFHEPRLMRNNLCAECYKDYLEEIDYYEYAYESD